MQSSGCEVPQWMLQLKKPSKYVTMATMNTSAGLVPLSQLELIGSAKLALKRITFMLKKIAEKQVCSSCHTKLG